MAPLTRRREWISGPAWICFRTELRRRWRGRNTARALGLLGLLAGLQLAVNLGVLWLKEGGISLSWLMEGFGLDSPLPPNLAEWLRGARTVIEPYLFIGVGIFMLPWQACR